MSALFSAFRPIPHLQVQEHLLLHREAAARAAVAQ
jgi:hypothetical protein